MSNESFLQKDVAELERFLLQQARRDRAPRAAHDRALVSLASVSLGAGLTASAKVAWGAGAASKVTPWLVTKWIAVGMTASLATFAAAEELQGAFSAREPSVLEPTHTPPGQSPTRGVERRTGALPAPLTSSAPASPSQAVARSPNTPAGPGQLDMPDPNAAPLPSSTAFGSEGDSAQLTREVGHLKRARAALVGGSPAAALETLRGYAQEFPSGALRAEAAALRVEAVAAQGNRVLARRLADEFSSNFPSSPLAARVRAVSGLPAAGEKP